MTVTKLILTITKEIEAIDSQDYEAIKEDLLQELEEQGFVNVSIVSEKEEDIDEDYDYSDEEDDGSLFG